MFLLDTDIIIYSLKGNTNVLRNLGRFKDAPMSICVITLMELYYGAHKSQRVSANLAKVNAIEEAFDVLPVGAEISETLGLLKAQLEVGGRRVDDFDLAIAACAMTRNLTLVTNNTKHFERIKGLRLTNWT